MKTPITWVLLACLVPYLTGCAEMMDNYLPDHTLTGRLWDSETGGHHYEPANPPELALYQDPGHGDILVVYNEVDHKTGAILRRSYLLDANQDRIVAGKKPHFLDVPATTRLEPIPLETNSLPAAATNDLQLWGVISPIGGDFTLISNGQVIGPCRLPVYGEGGNHAERILLTPVTVVGDVAIYSAIAAAILGLAYLCAWGATHNS